MSSMLRKDNINVQEFVVCITCFALYDYNDCFHAIECVVVTKHCSYVDFPNHRNAHRRTPCN